MVGGALLACADVKPVEMLFLGPYELTFQVDRAAEKYRRQLELDVSQQGQLPDGQFRLRVVVCDPPFEIPGFADSKGFWLHPVHAKPEGRRKILRTQVFTGIVQALSFIARQRSRLIVGLGQGALIAALLGLPLVVEAACRARITTDRELLDIRRSWAGVSGALAYDPVMLPQRSEWEEIVLAVPEIAMIQPRGFRRLVIASEGYSRTKGAFARALAAAIGTVCVAPGDPV